MYKFRKMDTVSFGIGYDNYKINILYFSSWVRLLVRTRRRDRTSSFNRRLTSAIKIDEMSFHNV